MKLNKITLVAAAIGIGGTIGLAGQSFAQAATTTETPSASSSATTGGPAWTHTPVTGAAADKATAAVLAKDAAVTVTSVRLGPDGSYRVLGTKAGAPVFYNVSKDFLTVTLNANGGRGGHFGGDSNNTPVTGAAATKVSAAVTAKDAAVTVTSIRGEADGSYDVFGTKAGATVVYEVSKDLATVTLNTGGGPGGGRGGHFGGGHGEGATASAPASAA